MGRKKKVTIASDVLDNRICFWESDWKTVLDALKAYQVLLNQEIRSTNTILHWICCRSCRAGEQCPKQEDLEAREDKVKEIAGILEYLIS